ncbi:MAG: hypothetical protein A2Y57_00025 [Candidatus Woykebacteria bacterium RBG_13_40_7b]|uniref:Phosphatidic acid phosphatase type 2/haloperoxidase domain-containing protein n=1 Tax=Candidatus Woykebacteria bacterium RBG_13_40_7b TaxID=1802594 RepID=A0A1G1W6T9_9BACT|nr:MAG: hypothetical protein A2Y57_00025 [Candidatus Woykebacteria bacterium RBG_13_40_7b]
MSRVSFAKFISRLLNPFFVGVLSTVLVLFKVNLESNEKVFWFFLIVILGFFTPVLVLFYQKSKGIIADWNVKERSQRYWAQGVTTLSLFLVSWLSFALLDDKSLQAFLSASFLNAGATFLINRFWKISVHASSMTLFCLTLIFLYSFWYLPSILLIVLVSWSRLKLTYHTLDQISGGVIINLVITSGVFGFFGLI